MLRAVVGLCCVICGSYVSLDAWLSWQRAQQEAPPSPIPRPVAPGWGTT